MLIEPVPASVCESGWVWWKAAARNKFGSWHNAAVARGRYSISGRAPAHLITDWRRLSVISDASGHKSGATRFYCRRKMSTRKGRERVHEFCLPAPHSHTDLGMCTHWGYKRLKGSIPVKARCQTPISWVALSLICCNMWVGCVHTADLWN